MGKLLETWWEKLSIKLTMLIIFPSDNGMSNGGSYNGINSFGSGGYNGFKSSGGVYGDIGTIRKPTRLEALPSSGPVKKKSVPLLNTMGTF